MYNMHELDGYSFLVINTISYMTLMTNSAQTKHSLHAVDDAHNDGTEETNGVVLETRRGVAGYLSRRSGSGIAASTIANASVGYTGNNWRSDMGLGSWS